MIELTEAEASAVEGVVAGQDYQAIQRYLEAKQATWLLHGEHRVPTVEEVRSIARRVAAAAVLLRANAESDGLTATLENNILCLKFTTISCATLSLSAPEATAEK